VRQLHRSARKIQRQRSAVVPLGATGAVLNFRLMFVASAS
jgi:hypothetical protein